MKLFPFLTFSVVSACSDNFINCNSLAHECSNKYIRDSCKVTCNACNEKPQLTQYQKRQIEKPMRQAKRKYARKVAAKYGVNFMAATMCADVFSTCPTYQFLCSNPGSTYAQNCKKTCGLCGNKSSNQNKSKSKKKTKTTRKPKTTKPRRTTKRTTRKPKTTKSSWATAAPIAFTQRYPFTMGSPSLPQYQFTQPQYHNPWQYPQKPYQFQPAYPTPAYYTPYAHLTQAPTVASTYSQYKHQYPNQSPAYQQQLVQPTQNSSSCSDRATNCSTTKQYCHSSPGSSLTEQIRKYCQKTCGLCRVSVTMPPTPKPTTKRTTKRTTARTKRPRPEKTTRRTPTKRTTTTRKTTTRRTTTRPTPKINLTLNVDKYISFIPTTKNTITSTVAATPSMEFEGRKCVDIWSNCDRLVPSCNQSYIKNNCFKTCLAECKPLSIATKRTTTTTSTRTEVVTTTESFETSTTDGWTMTTASTTTFVSEIRDGECGDILPTCVENKENCFLEHNELFLEVCRKTCGVCGVKDTFLVMAEHELGNMVVFKYQIGVGDFEHIDLVNEINLDHISRSCSVLWEDKPLFLGAGVNNDEIFSLGRDSCGFRSVQKLDSQFLSGLCYSNNEEVSFCSPQMRGSLKSCWSFSDINQIEELPDHLHYHLRGGINNYQGKLTLIAGNEKPKVEAYQSGRWNELPSIPFSEGTIYDFSTVVVQGRLLTLGGNRGAGSTSRVWIFNGNSWISGPQLKTSRISPAVMEQDGKIVVLGGCTKNDSCRTETLKPRPGKNVFDKEQLSRDLDGFGRFGEHVFFVDNRYCS